MTLLERLRNTITNPGHTTVLLDKAELVPLLAVVDAARELDSAWALQGDVRFVGSPKHRLRLALAPLVSPEPPNA